MKHLNTSIKVEITIGKRGGQWERCGIQTRGLAAGNHTNVHFKSRSGFQFMQFVLDMKAIILCVFNQQFRCKIEGTTLKWKKRSPFCPSIMEALFPGYESNRFRWKFCEEFGMCCSSEQHSGTHGQGSGGLSLCVNELIHSVTSVEWFNRWSF